MSAIRGRDTRPELALRHALWTAGVRGYRLHKTIFRRRPDIVWQRARCAVFVDGAFWHGHKSAFRANRMSLEWRRKIERNVERDAETNRIFREAGWTVLRYWDFQIRADIETVVEQIRTALASGEASSGPIDTLAGPPND
jgi:DNA mismatch endonuclease (patch repair protein)